MNKFIILVSILFAFIGLKAQNPVIINQPYDFQKYVKVKDALQYPTGCGVPSGTASLNGGDRRRAAIYQDSCGKKTYFYNPSDSSWAIAGTGIIDIDVFLIAGQSNAQGRANSALSPKVITGSAYQINSGVITAANDPIGINIGVTAQAANTGSAWPAFAVSYYNKTSRKLAFIPSSYGGSSQTAAANSGSGTWDTTGILFDSSVARVTNNMNALRSAGYNPIFKGVLWCQGETDAMVINSATITSEAYRAAFSKMIKKYRIQFGATMPFFIFATGHRTDQSVVGYDSVRMMQQRVANEDSLATIVFYNSNDFITRGLMSDQVHYSQIGYNEMGNYGALAVVGGNKNIWQPQIGNIYFPWNNVGIGTSLPAFKLDAVGGIKADTLYGGNTSGDSLRLTSTSHATKGKILIGSSAYNEATDNLGIGTNNPTSALHVVKTVNGNFGITLQNLSNGSASVSRLLWQTDASGGAAQINMYGSGASTFGNGVNSLLIHSTGTGGIRVGADAGDIVFANNIFASNPGVGRFKFSTGNLLINTITDNGYRFQVNGAVHIADSLKINNLPVSTGSDSPLVIHNNVVYKAPLIGNLATADQSANANHTHNFHGFTQVLDSLGSINILSKNSLFSRQTRSSIRLDPSISTPLFIQTALLKADNSGDSIQVTIDAISADQLRLTASNNAFNRNSQIVIRSSGASTTLSSVSIITDSVNISLLPKASADSITAIGTYNAATKTNPIYKILNPGRISDQVHTSGTAVTINEGVTRLFVDPASALASLAITMPTNVYNGYIIKIFFGGTAISSGAVVTAGISGWVDPSGGNGFVPVSPSSGIPVMAGETIVLEYRSSAQLWYQVK